MSSIFLLSLVLSFCINITLSVDVTKYTVSFTTGETAIIHKPDDDAILNTFPDGYPVILFLHGFGVNKDEYDSIIKQLSTNEYIVIIPQLLIGPPPGSIFVPTYNIITNSLNYLYDLNNNNSSDFYQQIDLNNVAIAGHSAGGFVGLFLS